MKIFDNSQNKSTIDLHEFITEDFFDGEEFEFHKALPGYSPVPVLPLLHKPEILSNLNIIVKDESRRFHLKAFKALGASYAIFKFLSQHDGEFTFCTATDGNHGRAVAWASSLNKMKSIVFVPGGTDEKVISNIRSEGAEIIIVNSDYDDTVKAAKKFSEDTGAILVQDTSFDGYTETPTNIMKGYLTQLRESEIIIPDVVILQAGVGTWAAAVILYYLKYFPERLPKFVIVEPKQAACCFESANAGKPVKASGNFKTIMAGLNCGTPSLTAFEVLRNYADYFVAIPDSFISEAIQIYETNNIESGKTGASGLAGLLAIAKDSDILNGDEKVLVFNSEGEN